MSVVTKSSEPYKIKNRQPPGYIGPNLRKPNTTKFKVHKY